MKTLQDSAVTKAYKLTINKSCSRMAFTMLSVVFGLVGCQTTTTDTLADINSYSATNEGSDSFNAMNPKKIAEVRTSMAAQYIREKKLDAAQRQLEKAFAANKNYAPAYDMMGILLQREGSRSNLDKADSYFKKAIELKPDFMQARNNYGVYLAQVGRNQDAIAQFEIAGSALGYENRIGALENLGHTALKVDDTELASQTFVRILDTDRNNLVAHVELVDILIDSNRILQAQNLYQETKDIMGDNAYKVPRILLQGIVLAHAQNNLTLQEDLSRQLLANFPLSEEATTLKGWLRNPEASWK